MPDWMFVLEVRCEGGGGGAMLGGVGLKAGAACLHRGRGSLNSASNHAQTH